MFSLEDMNQAINNLQIDKAPGVDCIKNVIIKTIAFHTPYILLDFFNNCLIKCSFPAIFKYSNVILIPKKTSASCLDNYRPISLLSNIGKVLERMILGKLLPTLMERGFGVNQYGFLPGRSTEQAINHALNETKANIRKGKIVILISIDFKGAFDGTWWPYVLSRLRHYKVSNNIYHILRNYLSKRSAAIIQNGYEIASTELEKSSPQGSVLGPILWCLVIDEFLQNEIQNVEKIAFADDLLMIVSADTIEEVQERATLAMNQLRKWSSASKTTININKSATMLMCQPDVESPVVKFDDEINLPAVKHIKYLGIAIDNMLRFDLHVQNICSSTKSKIRLFGRLAGNVKGYEYRLLKMVYSSVIVPAITYGASAWIDRIGSHKSKLKNIQKNMEFKLIIIIISYIIYIQTRVKNGI